MIKLRAPHIRTFAIRGFPICHFTRMRQVRGEHEYWIFMQNTTDQSSDLIKRIDIFFSPLRNVHIRTAPSPNER